MDHYDSGAWTLYRDNILDENQRRLMEDHLAVCDRCLQSYLAAAEEHETRLAELLPPDFTITVKESIRIKKELAAKRRRSRSLVNYTVAAAITLALMSSGIFDLCARELPIIVAETGQISRALEKTTRLDSGRFLDTARTQLEKILETKED
ncbi:MAG: hypothetical protein GX878_04515 [Firmicutes bacterium]|nr:hypothetical protein [Bacillota bacterium]